MSHQSETPNLKLLHQRLRALDLRDQSEPELLTKAYDVLIAGYLEARDLNREMEKILYDILYNNLSGKYLFVPRISILKRVFARWF